MMSLLAMSFSAERMRWVGAPKGCKQYGCAWARP